MNYRILDSDGPAKDGCPPQHKVGEPSDKQNTADESHRKIFPLFLQKEKQKLSINAVYLSPRILGVCL